MWLKLCVLNRIEKNHCGGSNQEAMSTGLFRFNAGGVRLYYIFKNPK